jgi:hypothetical protein
VLTLMVRRQSVGTPFKRTIIQIKSKNKKVMKKVMMTLVVATTTMCCYAQFKVNANGKASIGSQSPVNCAMLNLNESNYASYNMGIAADINNNDCTFNIGLASNTHPSTNINSGRTTGVLGVAGRRTSGYNYGVIGALAGTNNGAGIFGTLTNTTGVYVNGLYAGYFDGPVHVTGTLNSPCLITPSDMTQSENVISLADSKAPSATLNRVLGMNVISYNYKDKEIPEVERDTISPELAKAKYSVEKNRHYGLSAQELQAIYPDLVYKGQDGTLGVNYIELVPILIQSIQELKQELDVVKGGAEYKTRSVSDETADFNAAATGNVLYQNTPNPFKEQTTIRFRLADDATNAAICIFDMSGKMLKKLPVSSGMTSVKVNGYELGEGLYLYSLVVNGKEIDTKRMIVTK